MYTNSSKYYDALYHFRDYKEDSSRINSYIQKINPNSKTLLDVCCGTGRHLEFFRDNYQVEGLDINAELLEIARSRCPNVPFHQGDMMKLDIDHSFDVITCLFSSIGYVRTVENLHITVARMAHHINPNGILFIEPWFTPENYRVGKLTANFVDLPELKIAWMYISKIDKTVSIIDIQYIVGTPDGITCFTEKHESGLFTQKEYQDAFCKADLEVSYDPVGLTNRGLYIGKKR